VDVLLRDSLIRPTFKNHIRFASDVVNLPSVEGYIRQLRFYSLFTLDSDSKVSLVLGSPNKGNVLL